MIFGRLPTIEAPLAVVGGNCSIQGFDHQGNELFWTEREALLKKAEAPSRKRQKLGGRPRVAEGGYKE